MKVNIHLAPNHTEAEAMLIEGLDPVVLRLNEYEVCVLTKSEHVESQLRKGNNFHMILDEGEDPRYGYKQYIYTRLDEQQLVEHINDPSRYRGED